MAPPLALEVMMRKLILCLLGLGVAGSLLVAFWLPSAQRPAARSVAAQERREVVVQLTQQRPSAPAPSVIAPTATDPTITAHALLDAVGESEPGVDWAWEERLSLKPDSVVDFFHQPSATFAEWARAYRADICACSSFECVTALQDDFVSHAPPFSDTHQDEATSLEIQAATACAKQHLPTLSQLEH